MFATLLEPSAFAAERADRRTLVAELGGPYLSTSVEELEEARTAGLTTGLVLSAREGSVAAHDLANARALAPDICAVMLPSLTADSDRATRLAQLSQSLDALDASHRLLLAVESPLPGLRADEWRQLSFESLAIDPIRDPQSWRAAATLPGTCGLILGLVPPPGEGEPEPVEVLLWAAQYAASLGGRGAARVGVAGLPRRGSAAQSSDTVGGSVLPQDDRSTAGPTTAAQRVALLARTVALAGADAAALRAELDPRALSPIAAAVDARRTRGGG